MILFVPLKSTSSSNNARNFLTMIIPLILSSMIDTPLFHLSNGQVVRKPKLVVTAPLEKGDYPELETTECLDQEYIDKYQSLTRSLKWAMSLEPFDIGIAIIKCSSFRQLPRIGHVERAKRAT